MKIHREPTGGDREGEREQTPSVGELQRNWQKKERKEGKRRGRRGMGGNGETKVE